MAASMPLATSPFTALRASGRLIVSNAVLPLTSYSTICRASRPAATFPNLRIPVLDLDGTLIDSDEALLQPFLDLGVPRDKVTFGLLLEEECALLGIDVQDYLDRYDTDLAQPYPGVEELVAALDRWAIFSNKEPRSGHAELARLGWEPTVARFSDHETGPKELAPVLHALGVEPADIVVVGDTDHDRRAAAALSAPFALAGWNPRVKPLSGEAVLSQPADVLDLLVASPGA